MSANRDESQKFTFLYNNLYQIYKKEAAQVKPSPVVPAADPKAVEIKPYHAPEILGKRIEAKKVAEVRTRMATVEFKPFSSHPVESLKTNLKTLSDIQNRLHFMLKELEELSSDDEK